jgi:hypothetical protein
MPVSDQTYNSVMGSPLMTVPLQQIYWVLQTHDGLTKGEITKTLQHYNAKEDETAKWERQVPLLVKMGLIKKGNKRHCTVKNKEDVTWSLIDGAAPSKPKAPKPSPKAFLKAVAQLEMLIAQHDQRGDGMVTPELRKLYEWNRDKVEVK